MAGIYTPGLPAVTLPITGNELVALDTLLGGGRAPQTESATTSQLAGYYSLTPGWITGRFYGLNRGTTPVAVLTVTSVMYAYPVFIPNRVTVSTLTTSVTTGQTGGAMYMAIYADNGAGYPGALIYNSGSVTGLTSTTTVQKTGVATTLNAGIYWIATQFTATTTFPSVIGTTSNYSTELNALLGSDTAAHALATSGQAVTGIQVAATYATIPTTFTAGATLTINAATPILAIGV